MSFRKTAVAVSVALACSLAYAFEELPVNPNPPDNDPPPIAAGKSLAVLGEVQLGQATAGMAFDPVLRKAYVSNYTSGTLSVIDIDTMTAESFAVGANPRRIAHNASTQRTYIVNDTVPGTVTVFDAKTNTVLATIPVGDRPRGIAADFQRGEVYVSNLDSNTMSVIDTATNAVSATVDVGSQPFMGDVDSTRGYIYVVSALDRSVHVIDQASKKTLGQLPTLRGPNAATVDARTGKVYVNNVTDRLVQVFEPGKDLPKATLPIGGNSNFGSISDIYHRYYLPNQSDFTVSVINVDTDEIEATVPTGASPQQVAIEGADGNYYVANRIGNSVDVFDSRTNRQLGAFSVGTNPWRVAVAMDKVFVLNENGGLMDSVSVATEQNTLAGTTAATEWYHADFDHYFHTAGGVENRLLSDGIQANAWKRTMEFFRVWTGPGPNRVQVCRFFSTAFGARSSHVYVPAGAECDSLKAGTDWQFEALTYYVELPDAAGACRSTTVPLYRVYNNGMGGAPNHRLTASKDVRDAMVAKGWVAEGTGPDAVAACIPSLRGDELVAAQ